MAADALMPEGDARIAQSVLGTTDAARIAAELVAFCQTALAHEPVECAWVRLSIGATFGLRLDDGSEVVVKAHGPRRSRAYLDATRRVQRQLSLDGFPAPSPLFGPAPFRLGYAVVDEYLDTGAIGEAKQPSTRRAMATSLAALVALASTVEGCEALAERRWPQTRTRLWPTPHNVLFDFEATAAGAEWIDALAQQADEILSRPVGRLVVGHGDWSAHNVRIHDAQVSAVYDWDSLLLDHEPHIVGAAAAHFPYDDDRADWVPTPDEAHAFVSDYETARGQSFSPVERHAIGAAIQYSLAYTARCEHALGPDRHPETGARVALAEHHDSYRAP